MWPVSAVESTAPEGVRWHSVQGTEAAKPCEDVPAPVPTCAVCAPTVASVVGWTVPRRACVSRAGAPVWLSLPPWQKVHSLVHAAWPAAAWHSLQEVVVTPATVGVP